MNKYLSPKETGAALKYAEQTIYNMIHSGTFVEGVHYFRPTPRKILFSREAIIQWVEGKTGGFSPCLTDGYTANKTRHKSAINI